MTYNVSSGTLNSTYAYHTKTYFNKIPAYFKRSWLHALADPVYLVDFTWPYLVSADNCRAGSLIVSNNWTTTKQSSI